MTTKTINKLLTFKSLTHTLILAAIIFASIMVVGNIYKNIRHMYSDQPAGAGITCFFDMID